MKKLFLMTAVTAAALCSALEVRIEAFGMNEGENSQWARHCNGTLGTMADSSTKGSTLNGTYAMPAAGRYYVWVRTETRNENWRKVEVRINGKKIGDFGDERIAGYTKPTLSWKRALSPIVVNNAGDEIKVNISVIKSIGRIDCIVLSTDQNFKPSDDNAEIEEIPELEMQD